jgi:vacuolar-type H+-ATPase subunit H
MNRKGLKMEKNTTLDSVARGRDAIGNAASTAMSSAGSNLKSLKADVTSLGETGAKFVSEAGNEAIKTAREASSEAVKSAREMSANVAGQVGDMATNLADKGSELASTASTQVKGFAAELENMARRNPLGVLAGAVMFGVFIGMLGRRS